MGEIDAARRIFSVLAAQWPEPLTTGQVAKLAGCSYDVTYMTLNRRAGRDGLEKTGPRGKPPSCRWRLWPEGRRDEMAAAEPQPNVEVIPHDSGWQVRCPVHGFLGKPSGWIYAREADANRARARHLGAKHGPRVTRVYSFTRDQLIEALGTPEMWPLAATLSVGIPAGAESMADALIEALEGGAHA